MLWALGRDDIQNANERALARRRRSFMTPVGAVCAWTTPTRVVNDTVWEWVKNSEGGSQKQTMRRNKRVVERIITPSGHHLSKPPWRGHFDVGMVKEYITYSTRISQMLLPPPHVLGPHK